MSITSVVPHDDVTCSGAAGRIDELRPNQLALSAPSIGTTPLNSLVTQLKRGHWRRPPRRYCEITIDEVLDTVRVVARQNGMFNKNGYETVT